MNYYEVTDSQEMGRHLDELIDEFQRSIVEGKPFIEVKAIYLEIKQIKMALAERSDGGDDWMKGLSSPFML